MAAIGQAPSSSPRSFMERIANLADYDALVKFVDSDTRTRLRHSSAEQVLNSGFCEDVAAAGGAIMGMQSDLSVLNASLPTRYTCAIGVPSCTVVQEPRQAARSGCCHCGGLQRDDSGRRRGSGCGTRDAVTHVPTLCCLPQCLHPPRWQQRGGLPSAGVAP